MNEFRRNNIILLITFLVIAAVWICVVIAETQGQAVSPVVRIRIDNPHSETATGFFVGKTSDGWGVLVTANHVMESSPSGVVETGAKITRVVGRDWENDVALIMVPWSGPTINLADRVPEIGEKVGFIGATSKLRWGDVRDVDPGNGNLSLCISAAADMGDSGSPIFDEKREIIGIVTRGTGHQYLRADGKNTYGPLCQPIRNLMNRAGWNCQKGKCVQIVSAQPGPIITGRVTQQPSSLEIPPPDVSTTIPQRTNSSWQPAGVDYERIKRDGSENVNPIIEILGEVLNQKPDEGLLSGITAKIEGVGAKVEGIRSAVTAIGTRDPIVTNPPRNEGRKVLGIPLTSLAAAGLSALGIGIPTWAIVARRVRRSENQSYIQPSPAPQAVVVDAAPLSQRNNIDTHYVKVDQDNHQRASELAWQQIVRRYPGEESIQMMHKDLADQYLAGQTPQG